MSDRRRKPVEPTSDIWIEAHNPWYLQQSVLGYRGYLQIHCGAAFVLAKPSFDRPINIQIGYQDEETYLPICFSAAELRDWAKLMEWVAAQPWPEFDRSLVKS